MPLTRTLRGSTMITLLIFAIAVLIIIAAGYQILHRWLGSDGLNYDHLR